MTMLYLVISFLIICYFVFKFIDKKSDVNTIVNANYKEAYKADANEKGLAEKVLSALGNKENINDLDACITRLRVTVKDIKKVDKARIIFLGAKEVFEVGNNIQAVFGPKSDQLKIQIKDILDGKLVKNTNKEKQIVNEALDEDSFVAPLSGRLLYLKDVPDEVFATKMMGDGFAIEPKDGEVVSPVNGRITIIFPTKHAIGIAADNGREILIHFGIDTVNLKGEGFKPLAQQGDKIKIGQPILRVNLNKVKKEAPSTITPVIFTNLSEGEIVSFDANKEVKAGQKGIFKITK